MLQEKEISGTGRGEEMYRKRRRRRSTGREGEREHVPDV